MLFLQVADLAVVNLETALVEQVDLLDLAVEADLAGLRRAAYCLLGLVEMFQSITFPKFQASSKLHQCQVQQAQFYNHG